MAQAQRGAEQALYLPSYSESSASPSVCVACLAQTWPHHSAWVETTCDQSWHSGALPSIPELSR